MAKIHSLKSPKIKITLTTPSEDYGELELKSEELQGDLLRLNIVKTIDDVAGTFTFELVNRRNLRNVLKSVDKKFENGFSVLNAYEVFAKASLVDIYINDKEKMLGRIDSCKRDLITDNSTGKVEIKYTISGRDMGGLLMDNKIWYDKNPDKDGRKNQDFYRGAIFWEAYTDTAPEVIMKKIYDVWFKDVLNATVTVSGKTLGGFKYADDTTVESKLVCDSSSNMGGLSKNIYCNDFPLSFEVYDFEGAMFEFMKTFSAAPFNELYVDTGGFWPVLDGKTNASYSSEGKCYVYFRPCPFDDSHISITNLTSIGSNSEIHDLKNVDIVNEQVVGKNLSLGIGNIYTCYMCYPMAGIIPATQGGYFVYPEYDNIGLKKYGFNPLQVILENFNAKKDGVEQDYIDLAKDLQKKLKDWNVNNDNYLSGSFTIEGNEEIRVGSKLNYCTNNYYEELPCDNDIERGYYYITGVTDEWVYGQNYKTTLTVIRGTSLALINTYKKRIKQ